MKREHVIRYRVPWAYAVKMMGEKWLRVGRSPAVTAQWKRTGVPFELHIRLRIGGKPVSLSNVRKRREGR